MKISDGFVAGSPNHERKAPHDSPGTDAASAPAVGGGAQAENGANEAGASAGSDSSSGLIQIVLRFVEEVIGSANGLIEVYADRVRLSMRRRIVQGAIGAGVAVCAAVWLVAAALATLRGVCGGLTTLWGGRDWLGDLTGGLLALTLAAGAIALHLRMSSRREFGRLKAKYERIRSKHGENHDTASPADDDGGVARSRASAGAPGHRDLGTTPG